jgi:hypothetical protein
MVIALAGRCIDAPDADTPRFPPANEARVADRLRRAFEELGATAVVSSAAYGADLVALEVAGTMGLRRIVVLPWERERFRERSVVHRGQTWGTRYDKVLDEVETDGGLHVLALQDDGEMAFAVTNEAILSAASELAGSEYEEGEALAVVAVPVWEGRSRGPSDFTEHFVDAARALKLEVREVRTL